MKDPIRTENEEAELPYGGTAHSLRLMIAGHAAQAESWFAASIKDPSAAEKHADLLAHQACLYGWATVALLGFIASEYGQDAYVSAAEMVQDMGVNGGVPFADDLNLVDATQDTTP